MKVKKELTEEQKKFNEWFNEIMDKEREHVRDGVYDISGLEYFVFRSGYSAPREADNEKFKIFAEKYPDFVIAEPYETMQTICLSEMPTKKISEYYGTDFNHGANAIIDNCPSRILICAEND
jgi:alpha-galactosidase/6-phospho-beta-glucosidase family protein